jgi:tetratricopeptide (TPR) repeat protein
VAENGKSGVRVSQFESNRTGNSGDPSQLPVIEISKKARQKFRSRLYQEARELFRIGLEKEPDNPYLLSGMGDASRETGDFEDAERCYRRLLEVDKNNLFALRGLGDVCKKQGRHQESIRLWKQYLSLRPRDKHVMTRIADSCKALQQYDKAEEAYRQILQFAPEDRFALTGMADLQHRLGRDEEAIRYYEKVLEFDQNELHILTIIGKLCWRINNFDKAESYFRRALKIDPHNPYALYGLGNCYRWHRQYAKAIEIWQEILHYSEGTQALFTRMGDAYVNLGDLEAAKKSYLRGLEINYDRYALVGLIRLYSDLNQRDQATAAFWELMAHETDVAAQLEELCKRFVRTGQREAMLRFFIHILQSGTGSQQVLDEIQALVARLS